MSSCNPGFVKTDHALLKGLHLYSELGTSTQQNTAMGTILWLSSSLKATAAPWWNFPHKRSNNPIHDSIYFFFEVIKNISMDTFFRFQMTTR